MRPVDNPFAPGAGSQPPELAGRDDVISAAEIAIQRILLGRHDRSQILLGLRGTGKTVLLNKIEQIAESQNHITSFIEAPEDKSLPDLLYPKLHQALRQLSSVEASKASALAAMRALRSFVSVFKLKVGEVSISVDPEPGIADSGTLEYDLTDLFVRTGEAARAAGRAWTLLIDEVQYLKEQELAAIIVAIHRVNQKQLPIMFFGAGLPQIAGLSGDAKSYAERFFSFPAVGPLDRPSAIKAIRQPIENEGENIDDDALDRIIANTEGYPYFLQEWGYHAWNTAPASPITLDHIEIASTEALRRLDQGFFRVRFDRLTPRERDYVFAMASLGRGPYRSSDVAEALGRSVQKLGPLRARIVHKGMIYSPAHGDIAFTVPMFDKFLNRMKLQ